MLLLLFVGVGSVAPPSPHKRTIAPWWLYWIYEDDDDDMLVLLD